MNTPENFQGGKISLFYDTWELLFSSKWVLDHVHGVKVNFDNRRYSVQDRKEIDFPPLIKEAIAKEIASLLDKKVILTVEDVEDQIISNVFVRDKKDGSLRVILNLREFNKCLDKVHFKMESLNNAINMMTQGCYFASIDLKDAYYSVNILPESRKYFRFRFQGILYEFKGLPQGYKDSPRIFTKLIRPILGQLREKGHSLVGYIDDFFVKGDSKEECFGSVKEAGKVFDELGFTIHPKKSVLEPAQQIVFLGFVLDSEKMEVAVGDEKAIEVIARITEFLALNETTIRHLAKIIGTLVALNSGVWIGPLFWRRMEIEKAILLKKYRGNFDQVIPISDVVREDLLWWIENVQAYPKKVQVVSPSVTLTTDASLEGWGAVRENDRTGGNWTTDEKKSHINVLELKAVLFGLQALCGNVNSATIKIMTDNSTTMACINRIGSAREECNNVTRDIWLWCMSKDIKLLAAHLPGVDNVIADNESRKKRYVNWMLNKEVFDNLNSMLGPFQVDLFASRTDHQLDKYVSWTPDPGAWAIDAMKINWDLDGIYCFPPFCMISFILSRVIQEEATMTLITPEWPQQVWFPELLKLLIEVPIKLPAIKNIVTDPATGKIMTNAILKLMACTISGKRCKQKEYQKKVETLSVIHGGIVPKKPIMYTLKSGQFTVIRKGSMPWIQM